MFRLFTARIKAMFDRQALCSIREQMFRLFTARIKAIFDHKYIILVLENKCFVFLRRALMQCLITTLSYM